MTGLHPDCDDSPCASSSAARLKAVHYSKWIDEADNITSVEKGNCVIHGKAITRFKELLLRATVIMNTSFFMA
jgi:hypothetical protein